MNGNNSKGFTLIEVILVVVIISILASIAIPRLSNTAETAREKADITTGKQVKSALDRYQIEQGVYPLLEDLHAIEGEVSGSGFIPDYISKLDTSVTQQLADEDKRGFGIAQLGSAEPDRVIMIYLTPDGSSAEVKVFHRSLSSVIWSSQ